MQAEADDDGAPVAGCVKEIPEVALVAEVANHRLLHLLQLLLQLVLGNAAFQFSQALHRALVVISHQQKVRRFGHPREGQEEGQRDEQADVNETVVGNERTECVGVQFPERHHQLDEGAESASDFLIGNLADVHRADDVDNALADAADKTRHVENVRIPRDDDQQPADGQRHAGYQQAHLPTQPVDYESRQDAAGDGAQEEERRDPGSIVGRYRDVRIG